MNPLTEAREALALVVHAATGYPAFAYLPSKITAPAAIVTPGEPYLSDGLTYGSFTGRLEVRLVVQTQNNELTTQALDAALDAVIVALVNAGYAVEQVSAPFIFGNAELGQFLTADITTTTPITF